MSFEHEEPDGQPEAEPRAKTGSPFSPEVHEALAALEREEPLSVAEEIASEGRAGKEEIRARHGTAQTLDRHPHRRVAADVDGRVDRGGPAGKPHRVRRHQEAGPDLQDPQGAGQAQRPDVRRGDARSPARRLRLPPQPRLPLPLLPGRHLRLAQPDSPLRAEDRGHDRRARSARPRRTSATSPCCASRRSTTRTPTPSRRQVPFDELTPLHPDSRIRMETTPDEIEMRVVDLIVPIGFGQRGLIVSPPRAGKTVLMQKMAKAALKNYPDLYVFMLLIDERPEEVTDMERRGERPELRGHQLHLRRAGHPSHSGLGNGAGKGQADGRIRPRRADLPRFHHAAGAGLELRVPALRQAALRRRGRQRPDPPEAVLRLGPQGRGRRLADGHRHGPGRHRQPHGRGDFRGVQGHRQPGNRAGPQAGRSPHLARRSTSTAAARARRKC